MCAHARPARSFALHASQPEAHQDTVRRRLRLPQSNHRCVSTRGKAFSREDRWMTSSSSQHFPDTASCLQYATAIPHRDQQIMFKRISNTTVLRCSPTHQLLPRGRRSALHEPWLLYACSKRQVSVSCKQRTAYSSCAVCSASYHRVTQGCDPPPSATMTQPLVCANHVEAACKTNTILQSIPRRRCAVLRASQSPQRAGTTVQLPLDCGNGLTSTAAP